MILYEVILQVEPAIALGVEQYMRGEHIPNIFATGCFQRIHFDQASPARFRTRYEARTRPDLERYMQEHAPQLRADFQAAFPSGVMITRETWSILEHWE